MNREMFARHIQEMLLQAYQERHPDKRESISATLASEQHKPLFETVVKILEDWNSTESGIGATEETSLHSVSPEALQANEEERHALCAHSAHCSKRLVGQLTRARFSQYTRLTETQHRHFLAIKERVSEDCLTSLQKAKHELADMFDDMNPGYSRTRTYLSQLFQSTLLHIRCQRSLYKREIELGNDFQLYIQELIQTRFPAIERAIQPDTKKLIVASFEMMRQEKKLNPAILNELNVAFLEDALQKMNAHLTKRRNDFKRLAKVSNYVEGVYGALNPKQTMPLAESNAKLPPTPTRRMAFLSQISHWMKRK